MVQNRSKYRFGFVGGWWCSCGCSGCTSCSSRFRRWVFAFGRLHHRGGQSDCNQFWRVWRKIPKIGRKFLREFTWRIRQIAFIRRLSSTKIIQAGSKDRLYYLLSSVCTVSYKGAKYVCFMLLIKCKWGWIKSKSGCGKISEGIRRLVGGIFFLNRFLDLGIKKLPEGSFWKLNG